MESIRYAVVGLGAFGSAAAYHLARQEAGVVGFDRFTPPHEQGSSHGESRIIREAYFEDPAFVPLVHRAYDLWAELQEPLESPLMHQTGGLLMGPPDGEVIQGVHDAARKHKLEVASLSRKEVTARFPGFQLHPDHEAVFEPRAGVLEPEKCVSAHLKGAKKAGAVLRTQEPVEGWRVQSDGVHLWTPEGEYKAERVIMAGGAWTTPLLAGLEVPLEVERQVQFWLRAPEGSQDWGPTGCPIFAVEPEPDRLFYGLPNLGTGVKLAVHHEGAIVDPESVDRTVHKDDELQLRAWIREFIPALDTRRMAAKVCLYTNTPDRMFVVDHHPDHPEIVMATGGSGHGFKFSAAVGEAAAAMARGEQTNTDMTPFQLKRAALRSS